MWQVPKSTEAATDVAFTEDIQKPKCAPKRTPITRSSKISLNERDLISLNLSLNKNNKNRKVANVSQY